MSHLYIVLISAPTRSIPVDKIQAVVDDAKDWARFAPGAWFVASDLSAAEWYRRIRAVLDPKDNIVVHELVDGLHAGWATMPIVEFLQRDHASRPGV